MAIGATLTIRYHAHSSGDRDETESVTEAEVRGGIADDESRTAASTSTRPIDTAR